MSKPVKCVVWDLDNTLWDGTLLESDNVQLKEGVKALLEILDQRGILQSVASRNNYSDAMAKLKELGIDHFFLYPQINWGSKSGSVEAIRSSLNIGIDTIAFVDDQPFERLEVQNVLPEVCCIDAADYRMLEYDSRFIPERITEDSKNRRIMYMQDIERAREEERYPENDIAFLKSLDMELLITAANEGDLARAEELTLRTNQLNATGKTYSYSELEHLIHSDEHRLMLCELKDRFGSYGKIGLILLTLSGQRFHIEMMLFSCRVMSRGIGTVMLHYLYRQSEALARQLTASFRDTGRNRMMYMTYKMAGFEETGETEGDCTVLRFVPAVPATLPQYIKIIDEAEVLLLKHTDYDY